MQIAIDGPAGAGKSTIAKMIAKKLNYLYLDTGAMYRAVTYGILKNGISFDNREAMIQYADACLIDFDGDRVFINGEEITTAIRTPEVSRVIKNVANVPEIRAILVDRQREIAAERSVIMDGRDIASVVLPNADVKIYLDAGPEERAKRRMLQLQDGGETKTFDDILKDIEARDYADMHREVGALYCVPDAVRIDTTGKDIPTVCQEILDIIEEARH